MRGWLLLPLLPALAAAGEQALTWKRFELAVAGACGDARAAVVFTGPGGARIQAPAFRSGGVCRARIAFPKPGRWTWESGGRRGAVTVAAYRGANALYRHGFLRVAANGRYLEHADGTPFLWMGDTAWFGPAKAEPGEWRDYLADRARKRFSVIQIAVLRTAPKGQPAPSPAEQPFDSAGAPDARYWDRIDARVREANERGLAILMVGVGWPPSTADAERVSSREFARYLAARFFGDHVVFSPNFDQRYQPLFDRVGENLRASTPLHLITQHPNTQNGQNDIYVPKPYLSFTGLQSGHHGGKLDAAYTAAREWPLRLRALEPVKPVINIEAMYDGRGNNDGPGWREQDARRLGWISWLSGALGYTYGAGETARKVPGSNGGIWGFNRNAGDWDYWRKAAAWPSSGQMTHLRDFFARVAWWRLEPAPQWVRNEGGAQDRPVLAVASDRSFAAACLPSGGRLVLDLRQFGDPRAAEWFNPRTGKRTPAARPAGGREAAVYTPPAPDQDWALWLAGRGTP